MKYELIHSSIVFVQSEKYKNMGAFFINPVVNKKILPENFSDKKTQMNVPQPVTLNMGDGYSIQELNNRLIIQVEYPKPYNLEKLGAPPDTILEIAQNIKKLVKDVQYTALGINFKVLILSEGISVLRKNFFKESQLLNLKFQVKKGDILAINTLDHVMIDKGKKKQPGLLFSTNFHFDLSPVPKEERGKAVDDVLSKRLICFKNLKEMIDETCI